MRQRLLWVSATLALIFLVAILALVLAGWSPFGGALNTSESTPAQATEHWLGFTPFNQMTASIGLVIVGVIFVVFLVWTVWSAVLDSSLERLSQMVPHRQPRPSEDRSLIELIEDLFARQQEQHRSLLERIERLEDGVGGVGQRLRTLETPTARRTTVDDDGADDRGRPRFQPIEVPPPPPASERAIQAMASLESAFRNVLLDGSPQAVAAFRREQGAVGLEMSGEGLRRAGTSGSLVFAVPLVEDIWALVPGEDLISDFETVYSAQRSMPDDVKAAFSFEVDGSRELKLLAAGRAVEEADRRFRVEVPGRLGGLFA
jgi:hypothetical protein